MGSRGELIAIFCGFWIAVFAIASPAARAEPRIALVIANQGYTQPGAALANTHRDGDLVKAALEKVGFKVWVVRDTANSGALEAAIGEHVERLAKAGPEAVGFLYYSGHGAADRPDGANYLIPTQSPLTHVAQLPLMGVRLDKIIATLASAAKMSFVVFDACRNVALQREGKDFGFKGFAPIREQSGLLVAYATDPGNVAIDQSLYANALAEEIVKPGLEAGQVFRRVRQRVRQDTQQKQSPEALDKRDYDFHFVATVPAETPKPAPASTEPKVAIVAPAPAPPKPACTGIEVDVAGDGKRCLDPADASKREFKDCFTVKGERVCGPQMVVVPAGKFLMGSSDAEIQKLITEYPAKKAEWFRWEAPEREVAIPRMFAVGVSHVTRGAFAAFVAETGYKTDGGCWSYDGKEWKDKSDANWRAPGFDQDDSHPVVCVNWNDARAYVGWLKQQTGLDYRLLTEAETEYVARATTRATRQPRYFFGDDPKDLCKHGNGADLTGAAKFNWNTAHVANCNDGFVYTAPAGRFAGNGFGVKDVHGNAWSWTQDCFVDTYKDAPKDGSKPVESANCKGRVLRGGSWVDDPELLRSAFRNRNTAGGRNNDLGFRVARSVLR